jgi:hypothetical protein
LPSQKEIAAFVKERDAAMEADDLEWAAKMMPDASSPIVIEMGFHKARIQVLSVSEQKRRESMKWLADRGLTDQFGSPVHHDDPLPK